MSRIEPLEPPYTAEVGELLAAMMPPGAPPIGLFRAFARNVPMTRAMGGWGRYELGRELSLSMRDREIVIDRTCARCGCEYEWGVHVAFFAERVGFDADQVRSLTHGGADEPCWTDRARPAARSGRRLAARRRRHRRRPVGRAAPRSSPSRQLLDLLMLTGWYHAISYVARAGRIPPEPGAPTFADVLTRSVAKSESDRYGCRHGK